jgi:hypothetical protein
MLFTSMRARRPAKPVPSWLDIVDAAMVPRPGPPVPSAPPKGTRKERKDRKNFTPRPYPPVRKVVTPPAAPPAPVHQPTAQQEMLFLLLGLRESLTAMLPTPATEGCISTIDRMLRLA